jgi:hypothetical protein
MTHRMTPDADQSDLDDEMPDRDETTSDSDRPDYLTETEPTRSWPRALEPGRSAD